MESVTRVLATTNEISLKGANRPWFERKLTENVRSSLADLPVAAVQRPAWRVLVTFSEPVPFREVARRLYTVFGLNTIMPVELAGGTLDELRERLGPHLDGLPEASFAVRCIRSDKRFPMTSPEIEREIGTFVQDRTGWRVDLGRPDLKVRILVDSHGIYFWTSRIAGPGGLPMGVGGRSVCLMSGGIDSPVAAYMVMKRGVRVDFVHFHSVPQTGPAGIDKVRDLVAVLTRYQGASRLALVPLLPIQEQVVARCPAELRVLLYRRFMVRIGDRIARRLHGRALVTGESLGQVASQTVENLAAVEAVATLPVLRPIIGFDKQEIISRARSIGTYEISIQPHQDCCSYLMPSNPATRSTADELAAAEMDVDVEALVGAALDATEVTSARDTVAWSEIPLPAGAAG